MEHNQRWAKTCCLCVRLITSEDPIKYSLTHLWIGDFLDQQYKLAPNFDKEKESKFQKFCCKQCYQETFCHKEA